MRIEDPQRSLICLMARQHLAGAAHVRSTRERWGWGPYHGLAVTLSAGETLGIRAALRTLSPGRYRHYCEVAERIWRRFDR